jgi:hypothetical protein
MDDVLEYVFSYFTKWSAKTAEYVSTNHIQICTSDITIQHMASYNGHRGDRKFEILARTKLPSTVLPLARNVWARSKNSTTTSGKSSSHISKHKH